MAFDKATADRRFQESPNDKVPRQPHLQGPCGGKEEPEPQALGRSNIHQVQPRAFANFQLANIVIDNSVTGAD